MTGVALRLHDAACTDPGKVRQANEDAFIARPQDGLWAVADGMGGHRNGRWASQEIAEALGGADIVGDIEQDAATVAQAIHAANRKIHAASAAAGGHAMGSTAAALLIGEGRFVVLWAGDSRVYLWRGNTLYQLTRDHTQVQDMVERGLLTLQEARDHPMSHVISRAVGAAETLLLDWTRDDVNVGDVFLLCSDGLLAVASDADITHALSNHRPNAACRHLLDLCLERGAPDNVTIVAVACDEATLLSIGPERR